MEDGKPSAASADGALGDLSLTDSRFNELCKAWTDWQSGASISMALSTYDYQLMYLAIVIESEDAHQTSKVMQLLKWLDSIGVKFISHYDMSGVLKKSKQAISQKLKNVKFMEEANETVTLYDPYLLTLEFASYIDGKEAVTKAANLIFMENLRRHNLDGEFDDQILLEPDLNKALQTVGIGGPEPDLLLVYGPVRCHLGFPAWRIRYSEIVHMGSLKSMRYGSLVKAIYNSQKCTKTMVPEEG